MEEELLGDVPVEEIEADASFGHASSLGLDDLTEQRRDHVTSHQG